MKHYFLNFIEEGIQNPDFAGCVGGRVEVSREGVLWPFMELRFLTRQTEKFEEFRAEWDFKNVTREELDRVAASLEMVFNDGQHNEPEIQNPLAQ